MEMYKNDSIPLSEIVKMPAGILICVPLNSFLFILTWCGLSCIDLERFYCSDCSQVLGFAGDQTGAAGMLVKYKCA